MKVSIIIRTLNEAHYLPELLEGIAGQIIDGAVEVIVVDSGSSDATVQIAEQGGAHLNHIAKDDFSFGRSLNLGCNNASGDILVFISGHCVPCDKNWLAALCAPIKAGEAGYVYGRQTGRDTTKFSEQQIFEKYFPPHDAPQNADFFCNNANAAIARNVWQNYLFDEEITGLEDMKLARLYVGDGGKIAYASGAMVFHIHNESWGQTRRRYEREALAMEKIAPELHLSLLDAVWFFIASIFHDWSAAIAQKSFWAVCWSVLGFRLAQYWGSYRGGKMMRALSNKQKFNYFYPHD